MIIYRNFVCPDCGAEIAPYDFRYEKYVKGPCPECMARVAEGV